MADMTARELLGRMKTEVQQPEYGLLVLRTDLGGDVVAFLESAAAPDGPLAVGDAVEYLDSCDTLGWVWQRFGSHPHYVCRKACEDSISANTLPELAAKVRASLGQQEPPAPKTTFEQQLDALGAELLPSSHVRAENGAMFTFTWSACEQALVFATENRNESVPCDVCGKQTSCPVGHECNLCETCAARYKAAAIEVPALPPEVAEDLRKAGATVTEVVANRWSVRFADGDEIGFTHSQQGRVSAVILSRDHDNRLPLADWCEANGGEEAAVLAECRERGWRIGVSEDDDPVYLVNPNSADEWFPGLSRASALAAACAAAKVPTPWGPGEAAPDYAATLQAQLDALQGTPFSETLAQVRGLFADVTPEQWAEAKAASEEWQVPGSIPSALAYLHDHEGSYPDVVLHPRGTPIERPVSVMFGDSRGIAYGDWAAEDPWLDGLQDACCEKQDGRWVHAREEEAASHAGL